MARLSRKVKPVSSVPSIAEQVAGIGGGVNHEVKLNLAKQHAKELRLCAADLFYFAQFVRTEDEDFKEIRDFPIHYDYLHRVNQSIEDNQKTIILKSRRLMISWLGMLRQLHQALFTGLSGGHEVFFGGVASVGEKEAEYLVRRITEVYHRLPEWIKVANPLITDNKMYMEWHLGGKIQAFACKHEGPQTFGFSEFFFDEMAIQPAARSTWTGLIPTLGARGKVLAVSTPNGKNNLFHKIWSDKDQFAGMNRITIHWTENPEHDNEWFKNTTFGLDKQAIARMFELSFSVYAGQPVWDKYEWQTHVWDVEKEHSPLSVLDGSPVYHGWDFGYHFPAWVLMQRNSRDQWQIIDLLQGIDTEFDAFCKKVRERITYNRATTPEVMCIPPDGLKRSSRSGKSGAVNDWQDIENVFKQYARRPKMLVCPPEVGTRTNEAPRLKVMRKLFNLRGDDRPGLLINSTCEGFIEGCSGGYCYPDKGDSEQPDKNESSHLQDAAQAVVSAYDRTYGTTRKEKPKQKTRLRISETSKYKIGL